MAIVAAAPGASRWSQVAVGTGRDPSPSLIASMPMAQKYPPVRAAIRSSATEPSCTTT
jgi:hypothetical protein